MRKSMMCMAAMPMMPLMAMARMGWSAWSRDSKKGMACETPRGGTHAWHWTTWEETTHVEPKTKAHKNIVETAQAAGSFGTLLQALKVAKLDGVLAGPGPFTVFAPNDDAFAKLPAEALQGLLKNPEELAKVLKLHVVSGRLTSAEIGSVGTLKTLTGQTLAIDTTDGVQVGQSRVVKADIACENGVIHVLDSVLLPA